MCNKRLLGVGTGTGVFGGGAANRQTHWEQRRLRYRIYDRYGWEPRRHTHSHEHTYGGRQGHFGFHRPVILSCFVTWPRASSSKRGEGGKDTPLLGWRETRERKPNPTQSPPPPPTPPFFQTLRLPTPLQTCHTQTSTLAWDHEMMYFNVYAQFHSHPLDLSFFRGHSTLPRIIHSQNHSAEAQRCLHNSSSTWNTCTFTLDSAGRPCCFTSQAMSKNFCSEI